MKIELVGVGKQYGKSRALDRVDLVIPHRSRVALVGPNGSGKSTLLRILMGMLTHEGTVRLDGVCPFRHREDIARGLAYVPQIPPQLGASLGDVMRAVVGLRRCNQGDVHRNASRLGLSITEVRDRPFRALSGGMKQKALLALAFATKPSLIILDEPTASLDADTRDAMFALLDDASRDATVILCSHRADDLHRVVHRVIELHEGRVARDFDSIRGSKAFPPPAHIAPGSAS